MKRPPADRADQALGQDHIRLLRKGCNLINSCVCSEDHGSIHLRHKTMSRLCSCSDHQLSAVQASALPSRKGAARLLFAWQAYGNMHAILCKDCAGTPGNHWWQRWPSGWPSRMRLQVAEQTAVGCGTAICPLAVAHVWMSCPALPVPWCPLDLQSHLKALLPVAESSQDTGWEHVHMLKGSSAP